MRLGVAGTGHLGFHHARIGRDLADSVRIYDTDDRRMREVAGELGVVAAPSLDDLIASVDALIVACTTVSHYDVVTRALEAGRHVLVEKPLASGVEQGREMVRLASGKGLVLAVGHVERFNPAITAAAGLIDGPLFVEGHRMAPFKPRGTDVSVVMDLMIHDIDLVLSFVRSPVREIHASGIPVLSDKIDIASARLLFENGAVVNMTASRISAVPVRKLRFFQAGRYVSVDFAGKSVSALDLRGESIVPVPVEVRDTDALTEEISDFLGACGSGGDPVVTGSDGLRALEVAEIISERMNESLRSPLETLGGQ
jgi:predicted dehydrogenase